jgi:photosystem II stability/assembly factor-like uncharacterized protein
MKIKFSKYNKRIIKGVLFIYLIIFSSPNSFSQRLSVESLGGPYGGTIINLTKGMNGEVFANEISNGVYRYNINSVSWDLIFPSVRGISTPLVLNRNGDIFCSAGNKGILRSTDNGESYTFFNQGLKNITTVTSLAVNSKGTLFATTQSKGIYRSTDNGEYWEKIYSSSDVYNNSMAINSKDYIFVGSNSDDRIIRSTDNGNTWDELYDDVLKYSNIYSLKIDNRDRLYVCTESKGILRSEDNAKSWKVINNGLSEYWINTILFTEKGSMFAGSANRGIFRSTDDGNSWHSVSPSFSIYSSTTDSKGNLFFGADGDGILLSTDNGDSWTYNNKNITATNITSFVFDNSGNIFSGTAQNGIYLFNPKDKKWINRKNGLYSRNISALHKNSNGILFAGASQDGLYKSSDNGENWIQTVNPFLNKIISSFGNDSDGNFFVYTTEGLYNSTDQGNSWNYLGFNGQMNDIMRISNKGEIFLSIRANCILYSSNHGETWKTIGRQISLSQIMDFAVNNNKIYAAPFGKGIYVSTPEEDNWQMLNLNYYSTYITTIFIDSKKTIYAGYYDGTIIYSFNDGQTWSFIDPNPIRSSINTIRESPEGEIYVGTSKDGVYKIIEQTDKVTKEKNIPYANSLGQNYPNPFNSSTNINFSLIEGSHVTIKIYNCLGEEVGSLLSEYKQPGSYIVRWKAGDASNGVFYYKLISETSSNRYEEIKKMLYIK